MRQLVQSALHSWPAGPHEPTASGSMPAVDRASILPGVLQLVAAMQGDARGGALAAPLHAWPPPPPAPPLAGRPAAALDAADRTAALGPLASAASRSGMGSQGPGGEGAGDAEGSMCADPHDPPPNKRQRCGGGQPLPTGTAAHGAAEAAAASASASAWHSQQQLQQLGQVAAAGCYSSPFLVPLPPLTAIVSRQHVAVAGGGVSSVPLPLPPPLPADLQAAAVGRGSGVHGATVVQQAEVSTWGRAPVPDAAPRAVAAALAADAAAGRGSVDAALHAAGPAGVGGQQAMQLPLPAVGPPAVAGRGLPGQPLQLPLPLPLTAGGSAGGGGGAGGGGDGRGGEGGGGGGLQGPLARSCAGPSPSAAASSVPAGGGPYVPQVLQQQQVRCASARARARARGRAGRAAVAWPSKAFGGG